MTKTKHFWLKVSVQVVSAGVFFTIISPEVVGWKWGLAYTALSAFVSINQWEWDGDSER